MREVQARVPFAIGISLEEHATKGKLGCIGGNGEGEREVREMENEFGQK